MAKVEYGLRIRTCQNELILVSCTQRIDVPDSYISSSFYFLFRHTVAIFITNLPTRLSCSLTLSEFDTHPEF